MPAGKIEIDAAQMVGAGGHCLYAADSARKAAERLGRVAVTSGIFGDFAAAQQFHAVVRAAHQGHQERLLDHHAALTALSGHASDPARVFTACDVSAAEAISSAAPEAD